MVLRPDENISHFGIEQWMAMFEYPALAKYYAIRRHLSVKDNLVFYKETRFVPDLDKRQ